MILVSIACLQIANHEKALEHNSCDLSSDKSWQFNS